MATLSCAEICAKCHQVCIQTAMNHCLQAGGKHIEPKHFRLMITCAQICQVSADLQLSGSEFFHDYCILCANTCEACADSCAELEGMDDCEKACRDCASSCRALH